MIPWQMFTLNCNMLQSKHISARYDTSNCITCSWTRSSLPGYSLQAPLNCEISQDSVKTPRLQHKAPLDRQIIAENSSCGHPNVSKHTKFLHIISINNNSSTNDMNFVNATSIFKNMVVPINRNMFSWNQP